MACMVHILERRSGRGSAVLACSTRGSATAAEKSNGGGPVNAARYVAMGLHSAPGGRAHGAMACNGRVGCYRARVNPDCNKG